MAVGIEIQNDVLRVALTLLVCAALLGGAVYYAVSYTHLGVEEDHVVAVPHGVSDGCLCDIDRVCLAHFDEALMDELKAVKAAVNPDEIRCV